MHPLQKNGRGEEKKKGKKEKEKQQESPVLRNWYVGGTRDHLALRELIIAMAIKRMPYCCARRPHVLPSYLLGIAIANCSDP